MPLIMQRYATPFITGLFLVSLASGIALFLHVGQSVFHEMHEWLSMVLIAPFVLHLWRNWRPMTGYFSKLPFKIAIGASLAAAAAFALAPAGAQRAGGPPQFRLVHALAGATPAQLAPALGADAGALVASLKGAGFADAAANAPLSEIAAKAGKDEADLAAALASAVRR